MKAKDKYQINILFNADVTKEQVEDIHKQLSMVGSHPAINKIVIEKQRGAK